MISQEPHKMWRIRLGTGADAASLADLAERTFRDTYGADDLRDVDVYCSRNFSRAIQEEELRDPATVILVAEHDGSLIAYARVQLRSVAAADMFESPVELCRLYVQSPWQGKGVAQELLREAVAQALRSGAKQIRLSVWERNARAIRFYKKVGFRKSGEEIFGIRSASRVDDVDRAEGLFVLAR